MSDLGPIVDVIDVLGEKIDRLAREQRIANLIAYADLPATGKSERARAQAVIQKHLNLSGDPRE